MADVRNIKIFDTALRDGEQSPGCSMNIGEKLEVAQALVELGVDIIEAGFPIASHGDFEAVQRIAQEIRGPIICGLARCNDQDIDRAWEALQHAPRARIHVFLATSAIHREFKLKMDKAEIIRRAVAGVKRAAGYCPDIEFSPEDAARTEIDFRSPLVFGEIVAIGVRPTRLGTKSFELEYELWAGERLVAEAKSVLVGYDYATGRSVEVPERWRSRLEPAAEVAS